MTGEARRLAPELAEGVLSPALGAPPAMAVTCLASWRERLRITSDFMEMGREEPLSLYPASVPNTTATGEIDAL